jgi:lipoate-protein ligase A
MQATESVKVPDGKLVRVALTYGERIEDAAITGDFFLEPPEALADLEAAIEGHPTDVTEAELEREIEAVEAELIGFDAADLAGVTVEALR